MAARISSLLALCAALCAAGVAADETTITLKYDLRRDVAESRCITCHSLDYIPNNTYLDRAAWAAAVRKMVEVFGADIDEGEAEVIANYLADRYGR